MFADVNHGHYDESVARIRKEYWWCTDEMFINGRLNFLEGMLKREKIYYSQYAIDSGWDITAIDNIEREIESLKNGKILGVE